MWFRDYETEWHRQELYEQINNPMFNNLLSKQIISKDNINHWVIFLSCQQ